MVPELLVIQAATIDELLSGEFEALPASDADLCAAEDRLRAWCDAAANGDWYQFERRLAKDSLNLDEVRARLARAGIRPGARLPDWFAAAQWILDAVARADDAPQADWTHRGDDPLPFEDLWHPLVDQAQADLWRGLQEVEPLLSREAQADLARGLAVQLARLLAPPLFELFLGSVRTGGTRPYLRFLSDMRAGGWQSLFIAKPVLLRLTATIICDWMASTHEFLARLYQDRLMIEELLPDAVQDVQVTRVTGGLADIHNGGRSVLLLGFAGGGRALYKPRDLGLDARWRELIDRLNRDGAPIDLLAPRVVQGPGYGWVQFVDAAECSGELEVARYFRRAGALICLLHIFSATDIHEENVLAAGEYPVPVDLEMLLQAAEVGEAIEVAETHAVELAGLRISESVIMTGLLPDYFRSAENEVVDRGGLQNPRGESSDLSWKDINSDSMRPERTMRPAQDLRNIPIVAGQKARLGDYVDEVVTGFREYAQFLIAWRRDHAADALFEGFAGLRARVIQRPTRFYGLLLERLRDHRKMQDGALWSAQLDFVSRVTDWDKDQEPLWDLLRAERTALARLNVPHFTSLTDSPVVVDGFGHAASSDVKPGLTHARERFANLHDGEIAWQCEVIRLSTSTAERTAMPVERSAPIRAKLEPQAMSTADALARARGIGQELADLAIRSGPGAAWIGLDWLGDSEFSRLVVLGPDLYNGAPGISLFLAALAKATGEAQYAELALGGVSTLRSHLRSANAPRFARALGVGGATGLGSVVYGLTELASLLNESALLDDASRAVRLMGDELIDGDRRLDLIGGSAGGILGLLKLYRRTGENDVLLKAVRMGDHLLAQPRVARGMGKSWVGLGSGAEPLNGASHGAAGFALALAHLAAASGRPDFEVAARDCVALENASFSEARNNWPEARAESGEEEFWPCQWCHGAGGVGLARIGMVGARASGDTTYRNDVERSVLAVKAAWPYPIDTLCCGSLGNIELLFEAAEHLDRPALAALASTRLSQLIENADSRGDYLWSVGNRQFSLGMFRGLAGVGYTLLRRVDTQLPNILVFE